MIQRFRRDSSWAWLASAALVALAPCVSLLLAGDFRVPDVDWLPERDESSGPTATSNQCSKGNSRG